jgi:hypothetical protein
MPVLGWVCEMQGDRVSGVHNAYYLPVLTVLTAFCLPKLEAQGVVWSLFSTFAMLFEVGY